MKVENTPVISNEKYYPKLTEYGVKQGYNEVTIDYYETSVQRLYKIDDGEWQKYKDQKIKLELGETIYAKGIDKDGVETRTISSYKSKITLRTQIKHLIQELNMTNKLILQEDLANMKRVLRRLGYIENEVVTLKGQVACCISSADEILLTEMLFNGAFNSLDENSISSILSCFLATEGTGFPEERKKAEENSYMSSLHEIIKQNAEREADVLIECKLPVDKDSFIKSFKMEYMLPLLPWTQGEKTFGDICKDTKIYEGSIIRVIRRLDELLKELGESARLLGNTNLNQLFENTSKKIQRGIPFAASLYLSN